MTPSPRRLRAPAPGEAHVWLVELDVPSSTLRELERDLAEDERERAARYRSPRDRGRWVVSRSLLRRLLGECLDADPAGLRFRYGEQGKPALAEPAGGLGFNLSHAGGLALLAVGGQREVGVDLEREREVHLAERVAARVFPEPELAWWRALPEEERRPGFFRLWTRLEARAKLHGLGIWEIAAGALERHPAPARIHDLVAPPGYVAALAVEEEVERVEVRRWEWG